MRIAEVLPDGSIRRAGANEILRKYDVWGGIRNTQELPAPWSPLLYCGSLGHPSENATGLIYMRARYYDPVLGSFISEDPARDGGNWYAYAGNNPIGNVDPDGNTTLPEEITAAQGEAELQAGAGTAIRIDDVLRTAKVYRGNSDDMANWLVKRVKALARQEDVSVGGNLRAAAGKAIEAFKKGCGMGPADNVGFSSNGLFVVDGNNKVVGFVSHVLYEMYL